MGLVGKYYGFIDGFLLKGSIYIYVIYIIYISYSTSYHLACSVKMISFVV